MQGKTFADYTLSEHVIEKLDDEEDEVFDAIVKDMKKSRKSRTINSKIGMLEQGQFMAFLTDERLSSFKDKRHVIVGKLSLQLEVKTDDINHSDWPIRPGNGVKYVGILDHDKHSEVIMEPQSDWLTVQGRNIGWLTSLLKSHQKKLRVAINAAEATWFDSETVPYSGYVNFTVYAAQKQVRFADLVKAGTFSLLSARRGTTILKDCRVVDGVVMHGKEPLITRKKWGTKQQSFFVFFQK